MIVLVCGGRDYPNWKKVHALLDQLHATYGITKIVQGAAQGADAHASSWARLNRVPDTGATYKPDWDNLGRSAGIKRNVDMLIEELPDLVIGFPGDNGTAHMTETAAEQGIATMIVPDLEWEKERNMEAVDLQDCLANIDDEGEIIAEPEPEEPFWLCKPSKAWTRLQPVADPTPAGRYDADTVF